MTHGEMEPHWEVVVSYGSVEVVIPLPARQLPTDDWPQSHRKSIEAIKRIARALINEILHGVLVFFPLSPFLHLSFDDVSIRLRARPLPPPIRFSTTISDTAGGPTSGAGSAWYRRNSGPVSRAAEKRLKPALPVPERRSTQGDFEVDAGNSSPAMDNNSSQTESQDLQRARIVRQQSFQQMVCHRFCSPV